MQFLYNDGDSHVFMDNTTYDQYNVQNDKVGDSKYYLKAGMTVNLLFDNDNKKKQILDGRWGNTIRENKITGELEGPSKLFQNKDGEFVTIDTESLAFYQRAAVEVQYIMDGANNLNKKIANNIYDWVDKFLFPDKADSISPSTAKSEDLKEILANGRNADGKRVRIFEKYKLNEETNKYEPVNLNGADKLVVKNY